MFSGLTRAICAKSHIGRPFAAVMHLEMQPSERRASGMTKDEKFVTFASSLGTVFEWYDFYLYATLAPFFATSHSATERSAS